MLQNPANSVSCLDFVSKMDLYLKEDKLLEYLFSVQIFL